METNGNSRLSMETPILNVSKTEKLNVARTDKKDNKHAKNTTDFTSIRIDDDAQRTDLFKYLECVFHESDDIELSRPEYQWLGQSGVKYCK